MLLKAFLWWYTLAFTPDNVPHGVKEWEDSQPSGPPGTIHASINIRRFRVPLIRSRRPGTIVVCLQDAARLLGAAKRRWPVRHNRLDTYDCSSCFCFVSVKSGAVTLRTVCARFASLAVCCASTRPAASRAAFSRNA